MSNAAERDVPERAELSRLRARLPASAFARRPDKCGYALIHGSLFWTTLIVARRVDAAPLLLLMSMVAGHSLFCLALFAHELSHGSVLAEGASRRALETLCWGSNLIAPSVWHGVHNRAHHRHASTAGDPDRPFLVSERRAATRAYTLLFYPGSDCRWNPGIYFHFLPYVAKHTLAALLGPKLRLACVPGEARFSDSERKRILAELVLVAAIQVAEFAVVGRLERYLLLGLLPLLCSSAFVMAYVFTNHFLRPVMARAHPVLGTTSVAVPRSLDWLHLNFSYHTEHHCFPSMDSRYAPALSKLLSSHFGSDYQRIPFATAWRLLWQREAFAAAPPAFAAGTAKSSERKHRR
jgi:fatty acid desaturase